VPLNIAIDVDAQLHAQFSGIHHYLDGLLAGLVTLETEHRLTAFAPLASAPEAAESFARGLAIDVAGTAAKGSPLRRLTLPRRYRAASARYDVLHIPNAQCPGYISARTRHLVATVFDLTPRLTAWAHAETSIAQWEQYFEFVRTRCAGVLAVSQHTARDIAEHLGIPPERIHVTPLAARAGTRRIEDAEQIASALAPLGLAGKKFVLYGGSLEPRKNLTTLLQAFARAAADPELVGVQLVLAGASWGDEGRKLDRLAVSLGIAERVVRTGYVDDATMNALMSGCGVFAYLSTHEGFGMPPLEAMTCGAPTIVSSATSLPEVVGDGAVTVPPDGVDAAADALVRLLLGAEENARWRKAALKRAAQFSWKRTAELTMEAYGAALATG
jgi:glycosyltransferase involved in cell wall biosynthesis